MNGMEWNGMQRKGMQRKRNGMELHGMEWNGNENEIEIEEASNDSEKRMRPRSSFGDKQYKFYTKEFDEIIAADDLETEEELFRLRQNLDQQLLQLKSFISKLAQTAKATFGEDQMPNVIPLKKQSKEYK